MLNLLSIVNVKSLLCKLKDNFMTKSVLFLSNSMFIFLGILYNLYKKLFSIKSQTTENKINDEVDDFIEPLLDDRIFRYTMKPIDPKYEILWKMYKKQQESYWTAEEIDLTKDSDDFETMTDNEKHFIKMVLAFFASSDGIVNFNLSERFLHEIKVREALTAYAFQQQMENIHNEIYSDMLTINIKDPVERNKLFNAIETVPTVKKMSKWAEKWINSDAPFAQRLIAFAIVEGVFFSGAFAAIFWLKKQKGEGKLFMEGFIKSNRFIARDENMHQNFACALYTFIVRKIPKEIVNDMFYDAIELSKEFVTDAINCKLIGMNIDLMNEYICYVSDRLLVLLGYDKLFNVKNPFPFMEQYLDKGNFFETRSDSYQKSHNEENKDKWEFKLLYSKNLVYK